MRPFSISHCLPVLLLCIFCSGCTRSEKDGERAHITILYTTDIHGDIFPYDFTLDQPLDASMAHMMSYIDTVRQANPRGTLLLDGGDLNQGTPAVYWSNYVAMRKPLLAAEVLNFMRYDAVVLGNHDIEAGEFVYADRLPRQAKCHILAANAIETRTGEPMFEPYAVYDIKGFKVAVLGFITPGIHQWLPKSIWPNLSFTDMIGSAQLWMRYVKEYEKPDLIVGVFHAGKETYPVQTADSAKWQTDGVLTIAREIPGFDLILMGHDHLTTADTVENRMGEKVCLLQPAAHAEEIGRADIWLSRESDDQPAVKSIALQRVPVRGLDVSDRYVQHFRPKRMEVDSFLNRPLGRTSEVLYGSVSLVGPSNLMEFIHQVQLEETEAQISFASTLSVFNDIPAGDLTMRQIFSMYKYENQIVKMWMTGEEVLKYLEYGYARQFGHMRNINDHVLSFKLQADGSVARDKFGPVMATPQYNFTSAAGINYTVDISLPPLHRVKITSLADGSPFELNQSYTVAINSYQAAGGGGFLTKGLGWTEEDIRFHTLNESTHDMCYYIAQKIRSTGTVSTSGKSNWQVLPHEWWLAGHKRDLNVLLPWLNRKDSKPLN